MSQLLEKSRLHQRFPQLQVEGAAGQDERRVVIKALQDVRCEENETKRPDITLTNTLTFSQAF